MTPLLSILTPTIDGREYYLQRLEAALRPQLTGDVEWVVEKDAGFDRGGLSTGEKRNRLAGRARGYYQASIDDDDLPARDYVPRVLAAIEDPAFPHGPDCVGIRGVIRFDVPGMAEQWFVQSIREGGWTEHPGRGKPTQGYRRWPTHLNPLRASIARRVRFPDQVQKEDYVYSQRLMKTGLLQSEHLIHEPIYIYLYRTIRDEGKGSR